MGDDSIQKVNGWFWRGEVYKANVQVKVTRNPGKFLLARQPENGPRGGDSP